MGKTYKPEVLKSPRLNFHFADPLNPVVPESLRELESLDSKWTSKPIPDSIGLTTKLPFDANGLKVLSKRYLRKKHSGEVIETPEEMFRRVAATLAAKEFEFGATHDEVEFLADQYYDIMSNFEFIPAGRTLANTGSDTPTVPNCVVLHFEDDLSDILQTLHEAAILQQHGSGIGFPFDNLRPAGFVTKRTHGTASGPCSFFVAYNGVFNIIQQQNRHGNMKHIDM